MCIKEYYFLQRPQIYFQDSREGSDLQKVVNCHNMFGISTGTMMCISQEASLVYASRRGRSVGGKKRLLFQDQIIFIGFVANHP